MNFHRFRIFIVGLICLLNLAAQPKNPLFYHVYADWGITSDKSTVIYQDYLGYIWIGTEEGLNRFVSYAEYNFIQYKSSRNDSTTLDNDYITALFEDSENNLWIGTLSGLSLYNRAFDNFIRVSQNHPQMTNKRVHAVKEHLGQLWIATDDMLIVYDRKTDSIKKTFEWKDQNGKPASFQALYTTNDHIWVGTSDGLYFARELELDPIEGYENVQITSISLSNGQIITGTANQGLWALNKLGGITRFTTESSPAISSNQVNDAIEVKSGKIWVASKDGLTFLNVEDSTSQFLKYDFNNYYGLSDYEVRDLFEDSAGAVWMTTPLGGVNYYHESDNQFDYYGQKTSSAKNDELLDYNVLSTYTDRIKNELWLGSRSGISVYSEDEDRFTHYPFLINGVRTNNQILSIERDASGLFWMGTEKGLYTFDEPTGRYQKINDHPDFRDQVNVVFIDSNEDLWIGTQTKGLKRLGSELDEYDVRFAIGEDEVAIPNINDIMELPDGSIWVGTASGLFKVNENNVLESRPIVLKDDKVTNSWVNYLCTSTAGELIVGTRQEGLVIIKEDQPEDKVMISKASGLATNDIRSMIRMSDSLVWISTNAGLAKLTTSKDSVLKVTNFYLHDGLQGKQFTPKAGAALNKRVYFGGLSGITHFDPAKIKEFDLPLNVNFTHLHVNDKLIKPGQDAGLAKSIDISDTLMLAADQNNFTITFTAMDYMRPDSVKYRYKLENYDQNWMNSTDHSATYTNIPRGKQYTFIVEAVSRFRTWSEPKKLTIYIAPYFYETAWFKILVAFLTVGILFGVLRYREQAADFKQRNLQRLIDLRTKELKLEVEAKEKTAVELEKAKNDAEKANRIKSEFLANISHEIRTPLNGILGMSHLVSENEPNPENKEMLGILERSAESLRDIIDDLLDLSKIEAGKYDISFEDFDLPKLVNEIVLAFQPEAEHKKIDLKASIAPNIPNLLIGDELRIKQVIVNLLSNSLKFTETGSIEVILRQLEDSETHTRLFMGVKDTGIGIPYDKQEDVFSSFTQVETGSKRKYGGTGLGLAISKKLISLMGGEISLESTPGEGSFFKIELPLKHSNNNSNSLERSTDIQIPEGKKILLVEDNVVNTMVATKMLNKSNQQVDTASNGQEALERVKEETYDLILMDVQMPVMDGLEATVRIRQLDSESAKTPIVALTAGAMQKDREKALNVGMNDFLAKPISYDQLAKILSKHLSSPEEVPSMQK